MWTGQMITTRTMSTVELDTRNGVDDDQRAKLAEIAEKTPVTRTVRAGTEIRTTTGAA